LNRAHGYGDYYGSRSHKLDKSNDQIRKEDHYNNKIIAINQRQFSIISLIGYKMLLIILLLFIFLFFFTYAI